MNLPDPSQVQRVAIIGAGVIGGGWTAHFLRRGLDVTVYDPAPGAEKRLRQLVDDVWPAMIKLGLQGRADPRRLLFCDDLATAVANAQFIQENAPEKLPLKQELLAAVDAAAPPDIVIASSTSGFAASDLQARCQNPGRIVVGHPFNPPYLIPLVEVIGGEQTDPQAIAWAVEFYTAVGKKPLPMTQEIPGFIANRLQEALWREALHMVNEGMATVSEIDASIVYGPGLRWAIMGPCLTFHLAGGEGGMGHMLDHFDPAEFESWTKLKAPPITAELRQKMVDGCLEEADGRSIRALEQERDRCLIVLMQAIEQCR
jgi:carnitine 3-dehydrogenase